MELLDNILDFSILSDFYKFLGPDENGRSISIYHSKDVVVASQNLLYPNILFYSLKDKMVFSPYREKTMSLQNCSNATQAIINLSYSSVDNNLYFFFAYNTDNYYHFIYDSLPYLMSYFHIKQKFPKAKLLMGSPLHGDVHYKFVTEMLTLAGIKNEDIAFVRGSILYKHVLISNSYTHDELSNKPPREEVYTFFQDLTKPINVAQTNYPTNVYISRRSWIHNDKSNIGTDYTTRRKMINEDNLVHLLEANSFQEVFTETMSTKDKLGLFKTAKNVIGAIGGGMCNTLFCAPQAKVIVIVSPTFLEVNERFKYCFTKTNTTYYTDTVHVENNLWKKYMRVFHAGTNIVGEIIDVQDTNLVIQHTNISVTGWNNSMKLQTTTFPKTECKALDSGLNSNWCINLDKLNNVI